MFALIEDYVRNAVILNVVDGDTYDVEIDLGFRLKIKTRVRLYGVNCPEMKGESRQKGIEAREAVIGWLVGNGGVVIKTHLDKQDSFGRLLAEVYVGEHSLAEYLLKRELAVPFMEGK